MTVLRIKRLTKLDEKNINGICYDDESIKKCVNDIIKLEVHNVCIFRGYDFVDINDSISVAKPRIIGRCLDIDNDSVTVDIYPDKLSEFNNIEKLTALFRMKGVYMGNNIYKITEIYAIEIANDDDIGEVV